MARVGPVSRSVGTALLVLYTIFLPLLIMESAVAHRYIANGQWRHSVRQGRLDYLDRTRYDQQMAFARQEWNEAGRIAVSETSNRDRAEIRVSDANSCSVPWIGQYDYAVDRIRFNVCAMDWQGGDYPGTQNDVERGATPISRRLRTVVHEFGHALGLGHNTLGACESVLDDDVPYDESTCYTPTSHDRADIRSYWP